VRLQRRVGRVEHARLVADDGVDREQVADDERDEAGDEEAPRKAFEKLNVKISTFATPWTVRP
jgi:hypothetical protein